MCFIIVVEMAYIYMDESWDLGFDKTRERTSNYFVITFLVKKDEKTPNVIMKKANNWMKHKKIKIKWWVYHAFSHLESTNQKVLSIAMNYDISIMTLILDKSKVYSHPSSEKHIFYNIIVNKLLDAVINKNLIPNGNEIIYFIASRRETSKTLNEQFVNYLQNRHKDQPNIQFEIKTPHQSKWLQLVDTMTYSIFQKYEYDNLNLYSIFDRKIIIEDWFYD